jgi:hypothetical protein
MIVTDALLTLFVYISLFPIVLDNVIYHGYCKHCIAPAVDKE